MGDHLGLSVTVHVEVLRPDNNIQLLIFRVPYSGGYLSSRCHLTNLGPNHTERIIRWS